MCPAVHCPSCSSYVMSYQIGIHKLNAAGTVFTGAGVLNSNHCGLVTAASSFAANLAADPDTAKLTGPRTLADKRWVGPVKLLCIIMFDISKIRPKSNLGPVKAQKFSQCLQTQFCRIIQANVTKPFRCRCECLSRLPLITFWVNVQFRIPRLYK